MWHGWTGILVAGSLGCAPLWFACNSGVVEVATPNVGPTPTAIIEEKVITRNLEILVVGTPTSGPSPTPLVTEILKEIIVTATPEPPTPTPILSELSFPRLKELATEISYDDLFRNNEKYVGAVVYYLGQVIQVLTGEQDNFQLRVNVTRGEYSWDDPVFLSYSGPRLLDGDILEFVGEVNGLVNYEAIFGNQVTIPVMTVIEARLVAKASEPTPTLSPIPTPTLLPTVVATPGPTPTPTLTPIPTSTPDPITLAGRGQRASAKFNLSQGLAIFRMTHDGQGHFSITLLDSRGSYTDLLVNESGAAFEGSKALRIEEGGVFILDVSADENWSVTIEQPAPFAEVAIPITVSGKGQQASQFFNLTTGLAIFKMTHDGQGHFSITLLDSRGSYIDLLVNESGAAFDGSKALGIEEAGVFILDVSADGNWSVTIEQ